MHRYVLTRWRNWNVTMESTDCYREKAKKVRRIAQSLLRSDIAENLERLACEYDQAADKAEANAATLTPLSPEQLQAGDS